MSLKQKETKTKSNDRPKCLNLIQLFKGLSGTRTNIRRNITQISPSNENIDSFDKQVANNEAMKL